MTSKMLYVAGMKTESEFADVYVDFKRKCGIPSALRKGNATSEMSQRVKDITFILVKLFWLFFRKIPKVVVEVIHPHFSSNCCSCCFNPKRFGQRKKEGDKKRN
jgi:hypothetical protein